MKTYDEIIAYMINLGTTRFKRHIVAGSGQHYNAGNFVESSGVIAVIYDKDPRDVYYKIEAGIERNIRS